MIEVSFEIASRSHTSLFGYRQDTGSGPVGIFLHGFRSDCSGHKAVALAAHAQQKQRSWVRFDLAGHGRSGGVFEDHCFSDWLEDGLAVASQFPGRPLVLVGSSLGAWIAVRMAQMLPASVKGLVLLAPAFNFLQRCYAQLTATEQAQWRTLGWMRVHDPHAGAGASYVLPYGLIEDAAQHNVLETPLTLTCPLVVVHGDQDEAVPVEVSRAFFAHVDAVSKELVVVAGGDHRLNMATDVMLAAVDRVWEKVMVCAP